MTIKRVLRPDRLREVPPSFSWLDHRFIRDGHLERLQPPELLLYFFLVLVGDASGLSYYSLRAITRYLKLPAGDLERARASLAARGLIAYEQPLYQVLALPGTTDVKLAPPMQSSTRGSIPTPIGEALKDLFKKKKEECHGHRDLGDHPASSPP
jgi:hypothetical protein